MAINNIKYVILADSSVGFEIPRQLTKINGEPLIKRTIRLLKENGIKDIIITSHDKRFDDLGATRYEPLHNDYEPSNKGYMYNKGYWVSAFPEELLEEPICFLMGDVYYSENAIKAIVNTTTDSVMFFCTYQNKDARYIKHHDEPLGFKVVDTGYFKYHIRKIKEYKDSKKALREPIAWELYRSLNNQPLTEHYMTTNYIAINDESCDIDTTNDIIKLEIILGGDMIKLETTYDFTLQRFNELKNIVRKNADKNEEGHLYVGDIFECDKELALYLTGENSQKLVVAKVIEVPKATIQYYGEPVELKTDIKKTTKKTTKKNKK